MVGVLRCHRRPVRTGHIDMDDEGGGRGGSKVERVMSAARLLPRPQTLRLYATAIISPLTSTRTRLVNARPREMPAGVLHVCPRRVGSCHAMLGKSRCRFSNAETRAWLRFGWPSTVWRPHLPVRVRGGEGGGGEIGRRHRQLHRCCGTAVDEQSHQCAARSVGRSFAAAGTQWQREYDRRQSLPTAMSVCGGCSRSPTELADDRQMCIADPRSSYLSGLIHSKAP